jgi:hypothetical protein
MLILDMDNNPAESAPEQAAILRSTVAPIRVVAPVSIELILPYSPGIVNIKEFMALSSVSDPHRLYADPDPAFPMNADPDPAFQMNADPDPRCTLKTAKFAKV